MKVLLAALLPLALLTALPAGALPERLLTGYTGALMGDDKDSWRDLVAPLRDNGFNTADFKLTPPNFDVADPLCWGSLERLTQAVKEAGLDLGLYLYDQNQGKRDPATPEWLAYVDPDGRTNAARYCLYQYASWRHAFSRVFFLAEQSQRLPITAVKMDFEMLMTTAPCLCPACFGSFCEGLGQKGDQVQAADRWAWVEAHGGEAAYQAHLEKRMAVVAQTFAAAVHEINPKLSLGFMPYGDDFVRRPWVRHLGTPTAPAIIDAWPLYTGQGYTTETELEARRVRELSSHARYVPWFRINVYTPQDLGEQAAITGCRADGYNLWTISMIRPGVQRADVGGMYALPLGYEDASTYWAALKAANVQINGWLKGARPEVPLKTFEPLGPGLDLTKVRIAPVKALRLPTPDLPEAPAATGLRGSNTVVFAVEDASLPLQIRLRHLAGTQRPTPVNYAVVTAAGRPLQEGNLSAGATEQLSVRVPEPGTYALILAARDAGPWYSLQVTSHPYGVLAGGEAEEQAYFFRQFPRQYFAVPPGTAAFKVTYAAGHSQEARLRVWDGSGQIVVDEVLDADKQLKRTIEVAVPAGQAGQAWSLQLTPPERMSAQHWSENYFVRLEGIPPYLSDRPGALIGPAR